MYAVIYGSIYPLWPDAATPAAMFGAAVGTLFLELGLRKFAPFAARAVILRRFTGWDGIITAFVLTVAVGLLAASAALSFKGSGLLVESVAPTPVVLTSTATDDEAAAASTAAAAALTDDVAATRARYADLMEATTTAAAADLRQLDTQLRGLIDKEDRTGRSYRTAKGRVRIQISDVSTAKDRKLAELQTARAEAIAALRADHRATAARIDADRRRARAGVDEANAAARTDAAARVTGYGGGLAYFTLLCLTVFVLCVSIRELHFAGAGISEQVEPGAYDFEPAPAAALLGAVSAATARVWYGMVHRLERATVDAPEPVAAPVVWSRPAASMTAQTSKGTRRKIKPAKTAKAPAASADHARRVIGFTPPPKPAPDASDEGPTAQALTQSVTDPAPAVTDDAKPAGKTAVCNHCAATYEPRTTWQKYCSEGCRKAYHAARHNGIEYNPNHKNRSRGK
ncbi:hypothetical protein [Lewinella sp. 4G2]|uniref:hypothetical protein n=1 Tax=Lewinella sp. 4G2 TaxID=1803372 RepID=UPI0012F985EE|nr:hypothetical protein [Lewinella sp. 4G2]